MAGTMTVQDGIRRQRGRRGQPEGTPSYDVAFVLSGGTARGALQVGMLESLLEHGIVPDLIVGTSVGSWNGVWLASHPTIEGMRALERVWLHVRMEDIFPGGPLGVLLHMVQHRPSLYDDVGMRRFLDHAAREGGFLHRDFEHLKIPLAVVATNLTRGRPEIFDSGPLVPAILASSAIPAALPPVTINGEQYLDGGLLDNVGLRVAIERGARRIYVLDTSWNSIAQKPATSLEAVIDRSLQVVTAFHLQAALEYYSQQADVVVLRDESNLTAGASDFGMTAQLIAAGRAVTERVLAAPARESARSIRRRRTALWPQWPRVPAWDSWGNGPALRHVFAASSLSLPERVQLLAQALGWGVPRSQPPTRLLPAAPVTETPRQAAG
jgi:NTE family protein